MFLSYIQTKNCFLQKFTLFWNGFLFHGSRQADPKDVSLCKSGGKQDLSQGQDSSPDSALPIT